MVVTRDEYWDTRDETPEPPRCPKCGTVSQRLKNYQTGGRWVTEYACNEPTCYARFANVRGQLVEIFTNEREDS